MPNDGPNDLHPPTEASAPAADAEDTSEPLPEPVPPTPAPNDDDPWFCHDGTYEPRAVGDAFHVDTPHYHLELAVPSGAFAADLARLAEAVYTALADYFEAEPDPTLTQQRPLQVVWYASRQDMESAIGPVGGGGIYVPANLIAYLYRQPAEAFTVMLFVHEITHQFHYLARKGNAMGPGWYDEALAEYLSRHDWDGRCVRLGRLPTLAHSDTMLAALDEIGDGPFDLRGVLSEQVAASRAQLHALWRFLERGGAVAADGLTQFRHALDAARGSLESTDALAHFNASVGDPEAVAQSMVTWLPTAQQPMTTVFTGWRHLVPGAARFVGGSGNNHAVLKTPAQSFSFRLTGFADPDSRGGLLVGYDSWQDYEAYYVTGAGDIRHYVVQGNWAIQDQSVGHTPPSSEDILAFDLGLSHPGDGPTTITIAQQSFPIELTFAPAAGLWGSTAGTVFNGIQWQPAAKNARVAATKLAADAEGRLAQEGSNVQPCGSYGAP